MKRATLFVLLALVAECGGKDSAPQAASTVAANASANTPSNVPSKAQVNAALAAGNVNTGGTVDLSISGAKTAHTTMTDVGFCVSKLSAGKMSMSVFAMASNNTQWSISITNGEGMLAVGAHAIDAKNPSGVGAGVIDKSTGAQPAEWQQYRATEGTVTITAADAKRVTGSYEFSASPRYPKNTGAPVSVKGTFDAPPAAGCDLAAAGVK